MSWKVHDEMSNITKYWCQICDSKQNHPTLHTSERTIVPLTDDGHFCTQGHPTRQSAHCAMLKNNIERSERLVWPLRQVITVMRRQEKTITLEKLITFLTIEFNVHNFVMFYVCTSYRLTCCVWSIIELTDRQEAKEKCVSFCFFIRNLFILQKWIKSSIEVKWEIVFMFCSSK